MVPVPGDPGHRVVLGGQVIGLGSVLDLLALARMRLGRVHAAAEQAVGPEAARVYVSACNRLKGETCKTVFRLGCQKGGRPALDLTCTRDPLDAGPSVPGRTLADA